MGNYHSDPSIQPAFEPKLGAIDSTKKSLDRYLPMDSGNNNHEESAEITEVSIIEDHDIPLTEDWFNLARKLRGQNRQLLDTIVTLEQGLAESRKQLQTYQERSRHHNSLLSQQTSQLQSTQTENSRLLEQFQTCQTQQQEQQSQLQSLQKQLQTAQEDLANLERKCTVLKEESLQNKHQATLKDEEIRELQQRLQRQQRYSLQYKSALDQCLSRHTKTIAPGQLTESTEVDEQASSPVVSIQPWSSSSEEKMTPNVSSSSMELDSCDHSLDSLDQTLEELFSLNPDSTNNSEQSLSISKSQDTPEEETSTDQSDNSKTIDETDMSSKGLLVSSSVPFSFSIDRHRKEDAAREKVDLPSFLRRQ
ncbi:MAG: hypothetical protein AB4063_09805 [Crocosphaera sp.]